MTLAAVAATLINLAASMVKHPALYILAVQVEIQNNEERAITKEVKEEDQAEYNHGLRSEYEKKDC